MPASDYILRLREKVGHDLIMMPSTVAIICNDQDEVLLQRRLDDGSWSLPGGALDPGEEVAQCIIREVLEETGLQVIPTKLVGIYSGSYNILTYPNGDQVATVSIVLMCKIIGGQLTVDNDETLALKFFPASDLPEHLAFQHRVRIEHAYTRTEPYLGADV